MNKDTQEKIRLIIWDAINAHFILNNSSNLNANLRYEKNQTIAQVMAIGLCNQYQIDKEDVADVLCIDLSSYNNKLKTFISLTKDSATGTKPELKDWKRRLSMCSRYVRRNYETSYKR